MNTRPRMTVELAENFPFFIRKIEKEYIFQKEFSIITLIKLLYQLSRESRRSYSLYVVSEIKLKKSYLAYLDLCMKFGFIDKVLKSKYNVTYNITEKGRLFLGLFMSGVGNV